MAEAEDRTRGVVDVAAAGGVVVEVVRRAERLHKGPGQVGEEAAAIGKRDAAPTEGIDCLVQLVGNVIQGLVPGRAPPRPPPRGPLRISGVCGRWSSSYSKRQAGRTLRAQAGADGSGRADFPAARRPGRLRPSLRSGSARRTCRTCCRPCAGPGHRRRHVWCHDGTHCSLLPSVRFRSSIPRSV